MAFTNYDDWVASLSTFLVIPTADVNFETALPRIVENAEQRIYRELDLLSTIVRDATGALTANSRDFTFPQHMVVLENLNVFLRVGVTATGRRSLVPTSREYIDEVYGNETAAAVPSLPEYYAMITDQTIIVGPSPDAAYTMEVVGTIRPAPFSPTNASTYLTLYLPDLFFAETCLFGYAYMKNFGAAADDPQGSVTWSAHYKELWQSASVEELRKKYSSADWRPKSPSPIATPPRA